ncbi:hypothetical protein [Kitasatospora sp. NPDC059599]|uniref:hypothetical protein n=1 Tax=Kitasatospora sp. NPDC059599 TaxID=3346880 RepID=UPI0036A2CFAB
MAATLPDWPLRSARLSEALARAIGMLRAFGADDDSGAQHALDIVMDLARTIAAMGPAELRAEPENGHRNAR